MSTGFHSPDDVFGGSGRLLNLVESIYATVQEASLWSLVAEQAAAAMGGESVFLFGQVPGSIVPSLVAISGLPGDAWDRYAAHYRSINPIRQARQGLPPPPGAWYSQRLISLKELDATECYNDYFRPNRMDFHAGIEVAVEGLPPVILSCHRGRSLGEFDDLRVQIACETLKPHLERALMLHRRLGGLQAQSAAWTAALDAFDHAVFGLDPGGRVVLLNRRAEAMAAAADGIQLIKGRLRGTEMGCDRRLQRVIADAVALDHGLSCGALLLTRRSGKAALRLTATSLASSRVLGMPLVAALVFVGDPAKKPLSRAHLLASFYQLTPAETKVADLLFEGMEVSEAALQLGITLATCRLHIKRILGKTGAPRQSALIRLMSAIPGATV